MTEIAVSGIFSRVLNVCAATNRNKNIGSH